MCAGLESCPFKTNAVENTTRRIAMLGCPSPSLNAPSHHWRKYEFASALIISRVYHQHTFKSLELKQAPTSSQRLESLSETSDGVHVQRLFGNFQSAMYLLIDPLCSHSATNACRQSPVWSPWWAHSEEIPESWSRYIPVGEARMPSTQITLSFYKFVAAGFEVVMDATSTWLECHMSTRTEMTRQHVME